MTRLLLVYPVCSDIIQQESTEGQFMDIFYPLKIAGDILIKITKKALPKEGR